jgi:glycosyltransferase involved in cell wall biosynthesis
MNCLDLVVLPSRPTPVWIEQFGRVLTEALACKTLAIGADTGAIPEVLGDRALVFPVDDVDALSRQIITYAADGEERQAAAQAGYHRTLDRYRVERLAEHLLEIWRTLAHPGQ